VTEARIPYGNVEAWQTQTPSDADKLTWIYKRIIDRVIQPWPTDQVEADNILFEMILATIGEGRDDSDP
jgi:hypothetical protein